jgi:hypothetical protein
MTIQEFSFMQQIEFNDLGTDFIEMSVFIEIFNEIKICHHEGETYFTILRPNRDMQLVENYLSKRISMAEVIEIRTYTFADFCIAAHLDEGNMPSFIRKRDYTKINIIQVAGVVNRKGKDILYYIVSPENYI